MEKPAKLTLFKLPLKKQKNKKQNKQTKTRREFQVLEPVIKKIKQNETKQKQMP